MTEVRRTHFPELYNQGVTEHSWKAIDDRLAARKIHSKHKKKGRTWRPFFVRHGTSDGRYSHPVGELYGAMNPIASIS